tara:strand:+ start:441 stop:824 length:384 start_codon:yes stop_codon:yes gene_type:complete
MIQQTIGVVGHILDKFVEDKDLKQKLEHELQTELHRANMAQIEVNKVEAAHRSLFVSGWRPFIGWSAALGFMYTFLFQPLFQWAFLITTGQIITLPQINTEILMELTFAMLGMAGLRSFEKIKGVAK